MNFEAVIFDMDGVLVDSEPVHFATTNVVLGRRGVALDQSFYDACIGLAERDFFERVVRHLSLPDEPAALARERVQASLEALSAGAVVPNPGALEALLALSAEGLALGLASSATRAQVDLVLDGLGVRRLFAAVVCAEDVAAAKPAPDVFLLAAQRLGVAASGCVVIEDAPLGVRAARAAGMTVIALVAGGRSPDAVLAEGAVLHLSSLEQLVPSLLAGLRPA